MSIISASYKTDIPAFYGEWFENRLAEGFVEIRNPFNNKLSTVSLKPQDIDGFVFWTRNMGPFFPQLEKLIADRYPFYVQFSLTGYSRRYETSVLNVNAALIQIERLVNLYGPKAVVWRYDPVLISSEMTVDFHLENFEQLSRSLNGLTDEVVVPFANFYRKTRRNLTKMTDETGIQFVDPDRDVKKSLLAQLDLTARSNGQRLTLCTQPDLLQGNIEGAACVSAKRLGMTGASKIQGNREGCLCVSSKDIGGYDTCIHGCVYCYAVSSNDKAKANYMNHQAKIPFLR